jgi:hypothetical protein
MTCSVPPINHTQLDNGKATKAYDCGVEKTRDAIVFASCGKVDVDETKLRELMGLPGKQPTNPRDWKRAIESDFVAAKFKSKGLRAPKARLLDGVDVAIAREDLDVGRFLVGAGWYGTLNTLAPRKSGSRTFGDNHAFGVFGKVTNERTREYDPLADGRNVVVDGDRIEYPEGPQRILWRTLRRVFGDVRIRTRNAQGVVIAERKLGAGLFLGISIARAKPIADDPELPEPTPEPIDWRVVLADLEDDLGDLSAELETARSIVGQASEDASGIRRKIVNLEHELGTV